MLSSASLAQASEPAPVTRDAAVFAVSVALCRGATLRAKGFTVATIADGRFACSSVEDDILRAPETDEHWPSFHSSPQITERHDWTAFGAASAFVDAVGPAAAVSAVSAL